MFVQEFIQNLTLIRGVKWTLLSRHTLSKLMSDSFHEVYEHNVGKLLVKQLLELPA